MKQNEFKREDIREIDDDEYSTLYTDGRSFDQLALVKCMKGSGNVAND